MDISKDRLNNSSPPTATNLEGLKKNSVCPGRENQPRVSRKRYIEILMFAEFKKKTHIYKNTFLNQPCNYPLLKKFIQV